MQWRWAIAASVSLWLLGGLNPGQAETISSTALPPTHSSGSESPLQALTSAAALKHPQTTAGETIAVPNHSSSDLSSFDPVGFDPSNSDPVDFDPSSFKLAGADNFNPGLQLSPPPPEQFNPTDAGVAPVPGLEKLRTDFRNDHDNFGQQNRFIEETAQFRLQSGDIVRFKTGFNLFKQRQVESVRNIPLQVGWEKRIGNFNFRAAAGIDVFDRLATAPNLELEVSAPILPSITLTGTVEQGIYKSNAQTLENGISAWRLGPNVYWQIDQDTSLFALYRWGSYSDGNTEQQSYTRLERKFGQFSIAANLFTWSYERNAEARKGYFSPPDFLVYSGEVAWQGDLFQWLRCRLATTLGRQRINGDFSGASSYQALCTVKVSPNVEADVGYTYSNVRSRNTGGNAYENQSVVGQLRVTF
jgi:hypothetical protein